MKIEVDIENEPDGWLSKTQFNEEWSELLPEMRTKEEMEQQRKL